MDVARPVPATVGAWLAEREPAPPPALAGRLRELLGAAALASDAREAPEVLLRAGEAVLGRLLHEAASTRESALDLLAADALVTYAFEAASAQPGTLEARAGRAMAEIARVAGQAGAAGTAGAS
jgi:hypothetical protein